MVTKLFIVLLRRPSKKPGEMRSDPFWEFGSFGLSRCHIKNLLNPNKVERLHKGRLAFVQGGKEGFKLLLITPSVKTKVVNGKIEVNWKPIKPFKYSTAPTVIRNVKHTDFSYLINEIHKSDRTTFEGKFASAFRSRTTQLDEKIADKLINDFYNLYRKSKPSDKIKNYTEALPYPPPKIDPNRLKTYKRLKSLSQKKC